MSIGYQLKELRIKKGMSQQEVAERLLITRQSISKWELDKGIPDLDMLKKMAILFDFSIDELVRLKEEKLMNLPIITSRQMAENTAKYLTREIGSEQVEFLEKEIFQPLSQKLTSEKILWQGVVPTLVAGMATNFTSDIPVTEERTCRYLKLFPGDNSIYLFLTTDGLYRVTAVEWLEKWSFRKISLAEIDWLVVAPYYRPDFFKSGHGLFYGTFSGDYDSLFLETQLAIDLGNVLRYLDPNGEHFRRLNKTPIVEVMKLWRKKKSLPWD